MLTVSLIALPSGDLVTVDEQDFELLSTMCWVLKVESDGRRYAHGYLPGEGHRGKRVLMHRFILGITDPLVKVDHRDGDGLHNSRRNLRVSTNTQNIRNQRPHRDKRTAKFKGVYQSRPGKYRAQIECQRKKIHIGTFAEEETAARAYDAKAVELFGEFAYLNFPALKREVAC